VRRHSPKSGTTVSPRSQVIINFSEPMENVTGNTIGLTAANGRKVAVRVTYDANKKQARLIPKKPLAVRTRYSVKIGSTVVDAGDNALASTDRGWTFSTRSK
jgi:hypothetical protein